MDQLLHTGNNKSSSSKVVVDTAMRFLVRPATAVFKENVSVMSNMTIEKGDSDNKKELTMLKKEMKKMVEL